MISMGFGNTEIYGTPSPSSGDYVKTQDPNIATSPRGGYEDVAPIVVKGAVSPQGKLLTTPVPIVKPPVPPTGEYTDLDIVKVPAQPENIQFG